VGAWLGGASTVGLGGPRAGARCGVRDGGEARGGSGASPASVMGGAAAGLAGCPYSAPSPTTPPTCPEAARLQVALHQHRRPLAERPIDRRHARRDRHARARPHAQQRRLLAQQSQHLGRRLHAVARALDLLAAPPQHDVGVRAQHAALAAPAHLVGAGAGAAGAGARRAGAAGRRCAAGGAARAARRGRERRRERLGGGAEVGVALRVVGDAPERQPRAAAAAAAAAERAAAERAEAAEPREPEAAGQAEAVGAGHLRREPLRQRGAQRHLEALQAAQALAQRLDRLERRRDVPAVVLVALAVGRGPQSADRRRQLRRDDSIEGGEKARSGICVCWDMGNGGGRRASARERRRASLPPAKPPRPP
jgi:hypothetical protein